MFSLFIDVLIEWLDFINENKLGFAVIVTVPFTSSMGGGQVESPQSYASDVLSGV